jgi:glycerol-3-phosphate dehydrogenase
METNTVDLSAPPAEPPAAAAAAAAPEAPVLRAAAPAPPPASGPPDLGPRGRAATLRRAAALRYDLLVVGGGINGAGIAYDAAMRGFSVLLVEKEDFAYGTSSRSSKLIHGGIRYLKNLELGMVFESLRERALLLRLAPHLVRPMPFLYPVFEGDPDSRLAIATGLYLYDVLALYRGPARHRELTPERAAEVEPGLRRERLRSLPHYHDAWTNDARLVLATVQSAVRSGADVLAHCELRSFLKQGDRITGAVLTDRLAGRDLAVEARVAVNAAGPWLDQVSALERPDAEPRLKPTKGVHLVIARERLPIGHAVVMRSPDDGRMLFAIPWERTTLIGTTDTFFDGSPDEVYADAHDVGYLLRAANHSFPGAALGRKDVRSTYAGVRPLLSQEAKSASAISREHEIWLSPGGMISIGGGKYTTFRSIAAQVVDSAAELLAERFGVVRMARAYTDRFPFEGGGVPDLEAAASALLRQAGGRLGPETAAHLVRNFGSNAPFLVNDAGRRGLALEPLVPGLPYTMAEMAYAARFEMAERLADLFMRRTQLHLEAEDQGLGVAEAVARAVAPGLGWGRARLRDELGRYEAEVQRTRAWKDRLGA